MNDRSANVGSSACVGQAIKQQDVCLKTDVAATMTVHVSLLVLFQLCKCQIPAGTTHVTY